MRYMIIAFSISSGLLAGCSQEQSYTYQGYVEGEYV